MKVIFLITFLFGIIVSSNAIYAFTTISFSYFFMQFILCLVHFYS